MSCNCENCINQCESYLSTCCPPNPSYFKNCCPPPNRSIVQIPLEPLFPANEGIFKKAPKNTKTRKSLAHSKTVSKKRACNNLLKSKSFESHPHFKNSTIKTRRDKSQDNCEIKQSQQFETQSFASFCSNSSKMAPLHAEKTLKNFMYDNDSLKESKYSKTASCNEFIDESNIETWILQCPKGFDPKMIMNTELGQLKKNIDNVECSANKFKEAVTLACLIPEKAIEYESVCDNVRILRPVGKIFITETNSQITTKQSKRSLQVADTSNKSQVIECSDDDDDKVEESPSITSKKTKKINEQRFTIETTIKVENCAENGDRKKNRKGKASDDSLDKCMPICPPEPVPMKKRKKNK